MKRKVPSLAEELLAHREDVGEWSEEAVPAQVKVGPTEVVSFRMPSEELDALEEAGACAGETLSEYIRKAIAIRMHGVPIGPAVEVTFGAERLVVRSHIVTSGRTEAPASIVPDYPPTFVAVAR
ncbi:MAG: hypothetical protein HY775_03815 [Acidobacteria bacterium]|nr:hypothetical protein [Acidobacteriota bacterium]